MNKRDIIYYNYKLENVKPKKIKWKLYCYFRKLITYKESPSKVMHYCLDKINKKGVETK